MGKLDEVLEIRDWSYEEYPEFDDEIEGVKVLDTTGDEIGVHLYDNVEYETVGNQILHLEILRPFTRNKGEEEVLPCVVFVQGSAWLEQEIYRFLPLVTNLAKRGYAVAIMEYRHSGIAKFPAPVIDARNAVRFLRKNAEKYKIDPDKMIMSGDSSGGHVAVFAGMTHDDETENNAYPGISGDVKGIVDLYGAVSVMREDSNPTTVNHLLPDSPEGMEMGVNLRENMEARKQMSAECNIDEETEIPPVLIFHGTKDRIVSIKGSVDLYNRLKECGKDVEFYFVKGADHGGAEFWTDQVLEIVDSFVRKNLEKNV